MPLIIPVIQQKLHLILQMTLTCVCALADDCTGRAGVGVAVCVNLNLDTVFGLWVQARKHHTVLLYRIMI